MVHLYCLVVITFVLLLVFVFQEYCLYISVCVLSSHCHCKNVKMVWFTAESHN